MNENFKLVIGCTRPRPYPHIYGLIFEIILKTVRIKLRTPIREIENHDTSPALLEILFSKILFTAQPSSIRITNKKINNATKYYSNCTIIWLPFFPLLFLRLEITAFIDHVLKAVSNDPVILTVVRNR